LPGPFGGLASGGISATGSRVLFERPDDGLVKIERNLCGSLARSKGGGYDNGNDVG
jgi:hypothetical protein